MADSARHHALTPQLVPRRPRARKTSSPGRRRGAAEYAANIALAAHLMVAPMLFGGTLPWTIVLIAVTAFLALGASAYAFRRSLAAPAPILVWGAIGLLAWTGLQAVSLPCGWVASLAPESARAARLAAAAFGAPKSAVCALSRDPGATLVEIVKGAAVVATLVAAWLFGANGLRRNVLWMIAASTFAMSIVALLHAMAGLDRVFGFYKPVEISGQLLLAPLMNPNNLGAFAALGVPLWIGLTYRTPSRELRWLGRAALVLLSVTAILSLSRGAVAQLGLGALLIVICLRITRRTSSDRAADLRVWRRNLAIALGFAAACGIAMYVAGQVVTSELANRDISKFRLFQRAFDLAWSHGFIGVGRGAFSSSFVAVEGQTVRFAYPENFVLQWASEWGFPLTLAWLAIVSVALYRAGRHTKSLAQLAGLAALLAYSAQNLVDLAFELVGVAVVAAALLGAVTAPRQRQMIPSQKAKRLWVPVATMLAGGLAIIATLAPALSANSITTLDARLREQLRVQDRAGFRRTLTHAMRLHPSEPVFAVLAATEAYKYSDRATGRWINHAMQLAPKWAAPHILAFQWLWRLGQREQAVVELRQAVATDPRPWGLQICSLAGRKNMPIVLAAPHGIWRATYLEMAAQCENGSSPAAELIDDLLMKEFPERPLAFERSAARLAARGEVDEGLARMDALIERGGPDVARARAERAEMLINAERSQQAIERIDHDLPLVGELQFKLRLLRAKGIAYAQLGDAAGANHVVLAYRTLSADSVETLGKSYELECNLHFRMHALNSALAACREAYEIDPQTAYLLHVATLAGALGDRPQSIWAYVQLCAREPLNPTYCATRDQILATKPRGSR